jgi:hypothetical protein
MKIREEKLVKDHSWAMLGKGYNRTLNKSILNPEIPTINCSICFQDEEKIKINFLKLYLKYT